MGETNSPKAKMFPAINRDQDQIEIVFCSMQTAIFPQQTEYRESPNGIYINYQGILLNNYHIGACKAPLPEVAIPFRTKRHGGKTTNLQKCKHYFLLLPLKVHHSSSLKQY